MIQKVAVGGHQPYGFDQLMGQYNHFTVLKAIFDCENQNVQYADTMMLILPSPLTLVPWLRLLVELMG